MVITGLDRVSTTTKDALLEFISARIITNASAADSQTRRYLMTDDATARATALEAMGRVEAYKDLYQVINDNKPWVEEQ